MSRIKQELNWESPSQFSSSWRFDCKVSHLKDMMYLKTLNMTEKDDLYSKMVREGLITRDNALIRLNDENKLHIKEIKRLLKSSGIEDISHLKGDAGKIILEELLSVP